MNQFINYNILNFSCKYSHIVINYYYYSYIRDLTIGLTSRFSCKDLDTFFFKLDFFVFDNCTRVP